MSRSIPILVLTSVAVVLVGAIAIVAYQSSRSSEHALDRMVQRIDRLDDRLDQIDDTLLEMQRESRSSSESSSASDVESTLREITAGAQYFEELAFHVELLLEALAGTFGNAGAVTTFGDPQSTTNVADHLAHLEMLSERSREIRAERLRQFEATNRQLRHRWIRSMGRDLGFTADQEDRVAELYDRQSARWSELYERVARDGLVHSEVSDEMRGIREQTDRELEQILGRELKERFRAGEGLRFPGGQETDSDGGR